MCLIYFHHGSILMVIIRLLSLSLSPSPVQVGATSPALWTVDHLRRHEHGEVGGPVASARFKDTAPQHTSQPEELVTERACSTLFSAAVIVFVMLDNKLCPGNELTVF